MKKRVIQLLAILLIALFASNLFAKNYNMIFWYPGEAGTSKDAEPVLESFFDFVNARLDGTEIHGKYINNTNEGINYIKSKKPLLGIASWIALNDNSKVIPKYKTIAKTLPLPYGKSKDVFTLVGVSKNKNWKPTDNLKVYTSIPITPEFLKAHMIPDLKESTTILEVKNLFQTLKKIANENNDNQAILLTPMEKYSLDHIKAAWKSTINTIHTCKPIPTAEVILFREEPKVSEKFISILKNMTKDPEGKEILETLRLKGFK